MKRKVNHGIMNELDYDDIMNDTTGNLTPTPTSSDVNSDSLWTPPFILNFISVILSTGITLGALAFCYFRNSTSNQNFSIMNETVTSPTGEVTTKKIINATRHHEKTSMQAAAGTYLKSPPARSQLDEFTSPRASQEESKASTFEEKKSVITVERTQTSDNLSTELRAALSIITDKNSPKTENAAIAAFAGMVMHSTQDSIQIPEESLPPIGEAGESNE